MKDDLERAETYWDEIPVGRENAASYADLCEAWGTNKRGVREILHALSLYDNGDGLILIRSSNGAGFYRTDNPAEIAAYRAECLRRGRNTLAPLRKIDRVLAPASGQMSMDNNLRAVRVAKGLKAAEVCNWMRGYDPGFDVPTLSRMENGKCLPTPGQLRKLSEFYGVQPRELLNEDLFAAII